MNRANFRCSIPDEIRKIQWLFVFQLWEYIWIEGSAMNTNTRISIQVTSNNPWIKILTCTVFSFIEAPR